MKEIKCPRCGKSFIPAPYHIYKSGKRLYCSWTCFNRRNEPISKEVTTNEGNKSRLTERT